MISRLILPTLLLTAASAFGSFSFTLLPVVETTPPGGIANPDCFSDSVQCVFFQGTVTVDSDTFFTDIDIAFTSPVDASTYLANDDNFFQNSYFDEGVGIPPELGPDGFTGSDTYTGIVFEIDVDPVDPGNPTTPYGQYFGTATLTGGPDQGDTNVLGSADFEVDVVPEPATLSLTLAGLASFALAACKRPKLRR